MKTSIACLVLFTAGVCRVAARGIFPSKTSVLEANMRTSEALHHTGLDSDKESSILTPQNNRNGWVNPEDLPPMPQCIAQQDQSTWLSTMTKCTSKRCTSHFGVICTHHQWMTQLSCLSIGFSSDVVEGYLSHCSRSVLAKAQLYLWIRKVAGRTWLVDVGDANGLQNLSPASLAEGYAAIDVIYNAPSCLTGSDSALSVEPFRHVVASCSFKSNTQHTGNAARPWEYSEHLRSMIPLDSEIVGYNTTGHRIRPGDYFDRECFCGAFTIDPRKEPCSGPGIIELTRERLWMNATCGLTSLPDNWTDALKTTEFAYIPTEDWHWPTCVTDMPKQLIELTGQCETDACELDSNGYCKVMRAVDRACFCRDISYDSCGGTCKIFETRIDYVNWLHDLCGNVQDWHGLADDWRQLAAPTFIDMIPWRWTIKPSNEPNLASITRSGSIKATETCASTEWKLGSFALVNTATLLVASLGRRAGMHRTARGFLWHLYSEFWFFKGALIAALQLLANWFNVFVVQNTIGYEDVPVIQLILLWCTMPRLAWMTILLVGVQRFEAMDFSAAASSVFAETILSSSYMIMTVGYGLEHNFYANRMERLERAIPAKFMYAGALLWLISLGLLMTLLFVGWTWSEEKMAHHLIDKSRGLEEAPLLRSEGGSHTEYGTIHIEGQHKGVSPKALVKLYQATVISMLLLWIAQWLFWGGFIGLTLEEFCPPKLGVLTAVWSAFSFVGAIIVAI